MTTGQVNDPETSWRPPVAPGDAEKIRAVAYDCCTRWPSSTSALTISPRRFTPWLEREVEGDG